MRQFVLEYVQHLIRHEMRAVASLFLTSKEKDPLSLDYLTSLDFGGHTDDLEGTAPVLRAPEGSSNCWME